MRILPVLLLLTGLLAGCGPAMTFTPPPQTGHYRNQSLQFCLKVPKDWEIREGLAGQVVVCLGPRGDGFRENLVVTTAPPEVEPKTISERLAAELPGWKMQSEGVSPQGYPWMVGTHSQLGEELTALVVLARRTDKEFVLTFTSRTQEYSHWDPVFQAVLPTIHLNLKDCPPDPTPGQTPGATPGTATPAPETSATPAEPETPAATPERAATPTPGTPTPTR